MSPENLTNILNQELGISNVKPISVRKWGNEQTDKHTSNLNLFGTSVQTSQECLQKILERLFMSFRSPFGALEDTGCSYGFSVYTS